jgi:class 3 adenylate cyclase/tetratricopeptide (TPR) repeat protein
LLSATIPGEVRKVVTMLFIDVTGSTSLGERLDPESLRHVMGRYFDVARDAVEVHGGTVEKFIGDAVLAVFGVPVLHEDDALRAVRAAYRAREALSQLNDELERSHGVRIETRTGINTGEVIATDPSAGHLIVTGDAVNTAARLEQGAAAGEILLGEMTYGLTREAVVVDRLPPLAAKGKAEPLTAYRLLEVRETTEAIDRRFDSPLVGRGRELAVAAEAFQQAVAEPSCFLLTVLGAPGVGKSRLSAEIIQRIGTGATVLSGRCLPYGKGITFWPIVEILMAAGVEVAPDSPERARGQLLTLLIGEAHADLIAERIVQLVGLGSGVAQTDELFWGFRRLLEALARRRPLVVVFDDLHWAEPTLLDLIEHVVGWSRDAPILVLCGARQELLEIRSGWGAGERNAQTLLLEPLAPSEGRALVSNLLTDTAVPDEVISRIAGAAEGNPLFVEQLVAMLVDEGALVGGDGRWEPQGYLADVTHLAIPPTIHLLLAARLDRLPEDERHVLQAASVVGKDFWRGAVAALLPGKASIRVALGSLIRKGLVQPEALSFAGDDAFRFRHILIRDAAYQALPKGSRAQMHERFADWMTDASGDRLTEFDEILGYHLEEAYRHRVALRPVDDHSRALAGRAGEHLASAGRRALRRGDATGAVDLLRRATGLVDPAPAQLLVDLAFALWASGDMESAAEVGAKASARVAGLGDERLALLAAVVHLMIRYQQSDDLAMAEVAEVAPRAIKVFESAGDEGSLALAWHLLANRHNQLGLLVDCVEAAEQAVAHARTAGDRPTEYASVMLLGWAMHSGRTPVLEAMARQERLLEESTGSPLAEAGATQLLGVFRALAGRDDDARALLERSLAAFQEFGDRIALATSAFAAGPIAWMAGDLDGAERAFRQSVELLELMGERAWLSTILGALARVLCARGRFDQAEPYAERSRSLAAPNDFVSQGMWRCALAQVLAHRGARAEAVRLIDEATQIIDSTEALMWQADTDQDRATVMRLLGDLPAERAALQKAISRYEVKGILAEAARLRHRLEVIGVGHA